MKIRIVSVILLFSIHGLVQGGQSLPESFPSQGMRLFRDVCEGCIVTNGLGFNSHDEDCSCYYTCVMQTSVQLSSKASPWVSYKRCCPCDQTFSRKLLTCVDYRDKRSDCYSDTLSINPCAGVPIGSMINRSDPNYASPSSFMCSGFHTCVAVGDDVVPMPGCCPDNTCFDPVNGNCSAAGCQGELCASLIWSETRDCTCDVPTQSIGECMYQEDPNNITLFMGVENMKTYHCPHGTCWDQSTCGCISADNTVNDACEPFASLNFDLDNTARDSLGNTIWTVVSEAVTTSEGVANFGNSGGTVQIAGLSNTYLSNIFFLHFKFVLREDDSSSSDATQCIVGNCIDETAGSNDSFAITIKRGNDSAGVQIVLRLTYQNEAFMTQTGGMETRLYNISGDFELDVMYDFWLIYCGDHAEIVVGVLNQQSEVIGLESDDILDTRQLIPPPSGFVFGDCLSGEPFEGDVDNGKRWNSVILKGAPFLEQRVCLKLDGPIVRVNHVP